MTYIKPPASHECTWRSGPPPDVGWWPASIRCDPTRIRWWDGRSWSVPCELENGPDKARLRAMINSGDKYQMIQWTDRWWLK